MRNLAGETQTDLYILKELDEAGIEIIEGPKSKGEVPYTLTGKLGNWNFARAWYYWMARAQGEGLPLEIALELHNRNQPSSAVKTFGEVIRVNGDCGSPKPTTQVSSYHVDTQEGLNALAGTIRKLHDMVSSGTDPAEVKRLHDQLSAQYVNWQTEQQRDGVEWLKKLTTVTYEHSTVTELVVGIRDQREVTSIAKKWTENEHGRSGIVQHFFIGGQITGFNYGQISGPGQMLNRGPEIDEKLRPHYEELKSLRPAAADSLEQCMQELEKPGPEYKA